MWSPEVGFGRRESDALADRRCGVSGAFSLVDEPAFRDGEGAWLIALQGVSLCPFDDVGHPFGPRLEDRFEGTALAKTGVRKDGAWLRAPGALGRLPQRQGRSVLTPVRAEAHLATDHGLRPPGTSSNRPERRAVTQPDRNRMTSSNADRDALVNTDDGHPDSP